MSLEVSLSRRSSQDTFLITVSNYDHEIWRSFKINNKEVALEVFSSLDDFFHTLAHMVDNKELEYIFHLHK